MFPPVEGRSDLPAAKFGDFSHCGLKSGSGQLLIRENIFSPHSRGRKIVSKNIDNFGGDGLDCPPLLKTDIYPIGRPGCAVSVDGGHRPPYIGNTKIFSIMKLALRTKFRLLPPFGKGRFGGIWVLGVWVISEKTLGIPNNSPSINNYPHVGAHLRVCPLVGGHIGPSLQKRMINYPYERNLV
jgi:hypothetical protein